VEKSEASGGHERGVARVARRGPGWISRTHQKVCPRLKKKLKWFASPTVGRAFGFE
jgi:hypothetical protein